MLNGKISRNDDEFYHFPQDLMAMAMGTAKLTWTSCHALVAKMPKWAHRSAALPKNVAFPEIRKT